MSYGVTFFTMEMAMILAVIGINGSPIAIKRMNLLFIGEIF
jgi:hypothetical protein